MFHLELTMITDPIPSKIRSLVYIKYENKLLTAYNIGSRRRGTPVAERSLEWTRVIDVKERRAKGKRFLDWF